MISLAMKALQWVVVLLFPTSFSIANTRSIQGDEEPAVTRVEGSVEKICQLIGGIIGK